MSSFSHPLNAMFLLTILAAFICIQLVTATSNEPSERLALLRSELGIGGDENFFNSNSESDEDHDHRLRSAPFLRFGRQMSPSSGSFLRFGRSNPSFLRFGRMNNNGPGFLRFGRRALRRSPSNFQRFARKGEFLRFG